MTLLDATAVATREFRFRGTASCSALPRLSSYAVFAYSLRPATMPTYEYQCAKGHAFEIFQKISAKAKSKCPTCGAKATRIISGGAGLIFKGSGFYITDYGKDGKGPRKDGGSEPVTVAPTPTPSPEPTSKADPEAASKPKPKKKVEKAAE